MAKDKITPLTKLLLLYYNVGIFVEGWFNKKCYKTVCCIIIDKKVNFLKKRLRVCVGMPKSPLTEHSEAQLHALSEALETQSRLKKEIRVGGRALKV